MCSVGTTITALSNMFAVVASCVTSECPYWGFLVTQHVAKCPIKTIVTFYIYKTITCLPWYLNNNMEFTEGDTETLQTVIFLKIWTSLATHESISHPEFPCRFLPCQLLSRVKPYQPLLCHKVRFGLVVKVHRLVFTKMPMKQQSGNYWSAT